VTIEEVVAICSDSKTASTLDADNIEMDGLVIKVNALGHRDIF